MFAFTLPMTRLAIEFLHPLFVGSGRVTLAAILSFFLLVHNRSLVPNTRQFKQLALTTCGVGVAFPILTAVAMKTVSAAQGGVILAFLPLATALMAALIAGERPSLAFWLSGFLGCALVVIFFLLRTHEGPNFGDLALFMAVILAAVGYAMGAKLTRELGSWQVICWSLIISLPINLPVTLYGSYRMGAEFLHVPWSAWISFFYLGLFSQFGAFLFWYRGLDLGGIARVSQVQLLQPFMTIGAAAVLLSEPLAAKTLIFASLVVFVILFNRRTIVQRQLG